MRELRTYRPSGLIIVPSDLTKGQELAREYMNEGAAVVYMDRIPPRWRGDAVTSAHEMGAYEATRHLISLGHKRIATITGPLQGTSAVERLAGFQRAMKEAGLSVPREYVQESEFNLAGGRDKAASLLNLRTRPTAIFAANDLIAIGAIKATREAGLSCPDDISIFGCRLLSAVWRVKRAPPFEFAFRPAFACVSRRGQSDPGAGSRHPEGAVRGSADNLCIRRCIICALPYFAEAASTTQRKPRVPARSSLEAVSRYLPCSSSLYACGKYQREPCGL
jgi:hypothetical protein